MLIDTYITINVDMAALVTNVQNLLETGNHIESMSDCRQQELKHHLMLSTSFRTYTNVHTLVDTI
jgi:hypothetical protein